MPDDYDKLKNDLSKKFGEIEAKIREAESQELKIPRSLTNNLDLAKSQYGATDKKFSDGNEEEAVAELREVANSIKPVSDEADELYFRASYQKVCRARKSFEGHEDLADKYIPNFGEHSIKLDEIVSFVIEIYEPPGKKPPRNYVFAYTLYLQMFLMDFEKGREALFAAIKKADRVDQIAQDTLQLKQKSVELEEKITQQGEKSVELKKETVWQGNEIIRLKKNQSWLSVLSVGALVISAFVEVKSCASDTPSQQPAQPESVVSGTGITS